MELLPVYVYVLSWRSAFSPGKRLRAIDCSEDTISHSAAVTQARENKHIPSTRHSLENVSCERLVLGMCLFFPCQASGARGRVERSTPSSPAQRPTNQGQTRACKAPYSHWKMFPVRVWCFACSCLPLQGKHCEGSCGAEHVITHSAAANRARKLSAKKSNIHIRKLIPNVDVALLSTQFP